MTDRLPAAQPGIDMKMCPEDYEVGSPQSPETLSENIGESAGVREST